MAGIFLIFLKSFQLPSQIRKAEELLDQGEHQKASDIVKNILDRKKEYIPARYLRAKLLIRQNQYLMAISELNSILAATDSKKYINELELHNHLATLYNQTQNYKKEIEEYKAILTFNSEDIQANYRLGHALFRQKDYKRVKEYLLKAIILDPKLIDCQLPLGISCFQISDYEKAELYLTKSLEGSGDHNEAKFYLGHIYKMKKDFDNAVFMFNSSKTSSTYYLPSLQALGEIFFENEQYADAIDHLEEGLNKLPEKSEESNAYRYLLAECYEQVNKIKEATHHWEKIALENPSYRSTKLKLESYSDVMQDQNLMAVFTKSLEELQPIITELISSLNYNIVGKDRKSSNEYQYKAYNIKRINDPPVLIYFNRSTKEITEGQITDFYKRINEEKCKSGIYITTGKFSLRAKSISASKMIDLYDAGHVAKALEKIQSRKETRK